MTTKALRFLFLALALTAMIVTVGASFADALVVADCPGACKDGGGLCCTDTAGQSWYGHRN